MTQQRSSAEPGFSYDVVIPSHGRNFDLLQQAVESAQRQRPAPNRVVVVLDGRPDMRELVQELGDRVTVVVLEKRKGVAAARQSGINSCTSSWVAFLDDDDLWGSSHIRTSQQYVQQHPDCMAVCAGYWMFSATEPDRTDPRLFGQVVELIGASLDAVESQAVSASPLNDLGYLDIKGRSLRSLALRNCGVIGTTIIRRDLLLRIPSVPDGLSPGDEHLLFAHVAAQAEWHLIKERTLFYRVHGGQHSRSADPAMAVNILRVKQIIWNEYADRLPPIAEFGRDYAVEARQMVWSVLRAGGSLGEAASLMKSWWGLIPRWRHRLASLVPEPLVWRFRRLLRPRARAVGGSPTW